MGISTTRRVLLNPPNEPQALRPLDIQLHAHLLQLLHQLLVLGLQSLRLLALAIQAALVFLLLGE
jgi:hypothetical protein